MDDNVVREMVRKKDYFVIEVEIFFGGTASPAATLVADGNTIPSEIIVLVEVVKPREH